MSRILHGVLGVKAGRIDSHMQPLHADPSLQGIAQLRWDPDPGSSAIG
jgi:hypothetical protein